MKKVLAVLLSAVVVLSCFAACQPSGDVSSQMSSSDSTPPKQQPFPVTVRDITVYSAPSRVVSLSPTLTELICEYGYENTLVGRSTDCMYSTHVSGLPDLGTAAEPKLEEIIKLQPEYLFTTQPLSDNTKEWLTKNNIVTVTFELPSSVSGLCGLYSDLRVVFEGKTDGLLKGAQEAKKITKELDDLRDRIAQYRINEELTDAVSVMMVYSLDNFVAAGGTLENEILEYIGIGNAVADYSGYFVSDDALKSTNPHYIVLSSAVETDTLKTSAAYKAKTAVKKDRIISVDLTAVEKRSPRFIGAFKEIAEKMYPGVTTMDMTAADSSQTASSQE